MYIIWHDNDYDFALWVYKNTVLNTKKEVILKQIPKTNNDSLITNDFKDELDYFILPYIKFATPDLLIQKVDNGKTKIVFASEFMTHTPQHDHVMQRFERIFCISKEKVPVACVLPEMKVKIERGSKSSYRPTSYRPNPLVIHTYLKTTQINSNPTLVFFWPHRNGYLKYDANHQTAPKIEDQIISWIKFLNESIEKEGLVDISTSQIVVDQINFLEKKYPFQGNKFSSLTFEVFIKNYPLAYKSLIRAKIVETELFIKQQNLDQGNLPDKFKQRKNTVLFEYNSKTFRTDPYAGFLCGVFNLFCVNCQGKKDHNLILIPHGIRYSELLAGTAFKEMSEDFTVCPIHSNQNLQKLGLKKLIEHVNDKCTYTLSKHQRIFGTLPDIIIFEDKILYNQNYGY